MNLSSGDVFAGAWRIERRLAQHVISAEYAATEVTTGEAARLLLLLPQLVGDPSQRARFAEAARATDAVPSAIFPRALAVGVDAWSGIPWIAAEWRPGETLATRLVVRGALPPTEALVLLEVLAGGLAAAS